MRSTLLLPLAGSFALLAAAIPHGEQRPQPQRRAGGPERRQQISELLVLASDADVPLPTDPAVLLSLAPVIAQLASALPTGPVLSVLETAVPSGFLSAIVHEPGFAQSFEAAFAAGSSPSWFLALPTDVKSYLHTYSGYGGIATAVAEVGSVESALAAQSSTAMTAAATSAVPTQTATGELVNGTTAAATTAGLSTITSTAGGAQGTSTFVDVVTASGSGTTASGTSISSAGAARESGILVAGMMGVLGVLGAAVVL